ncbi:MAG: MerR family transcriptional regulator [Gammaproteobacteria bacterium]|nr:MerR family transcriptional regulator [Gammaproteobacteria bacterium]
MTIGRLARAAGVKLDTVRYYERRALMPEPQRSDAGYRMYSGEDLERLRFIRGAKSLGFSLDEIRYLLAVVDSEGDRAEVRALAAGRLEDMNRQLAEMQQARAALAGLVSACSGHGSVRDCPIVEAVVAAQPGPPSGTRKLK